MKLEDLTGTPRPHTDVLAALKCVEEEMIAHPTAMSAQVGSLLLHCSVIRGCLRELLVRREMERRP